LLFYVVFYILSMALFLSKIFFVLLELENDQINQEKVSEVNFNSLLLFLAAVCALIVYSLTHIIFRNIGH
jgi:hypothetical protein